MTDSKYGKYILTEDRMPPARPRGRGHGRPGQGGQDPRSDHASGHHGLHRSGVLAVRGLRDPVGTARRSSRWRSRYPHTHDFDEVIGFAGTNRNYPRELGGEIEFLIGGESHTLTKTCLIFVPKGLEHCPITIKRIDTPIFMFEAANDPEYKKLL